MYNAVVMRPYVKLLWPLVISEQVHVFLVPPNPSLLDKGPLNELLCVFTLKYLAVCLVLTDQAPN